MVEKKFFSPTEVRVIVPILEMGNLMLRELYGLPVASLLVNGQVKRSRSSVRRDGKE